MMAQPEQTLAKILKNGARALAAYALEKVSEPGESLGNPSDSGATAEASVVEHMSGEPDPAATQFQQWHHLLTARLEELSVAVLTGTPERFVEQVRWIRAALESRGVPPRALRARLEALRSVLAEEIPAALAPLAIAYLDRALQEFHGDPPGMTPRLSADTPEGRLAAAYLVAILEGDRHRARRLVLDAVDQGVPPLEIYRKVLLPAQEELGRMWVLDEINVAEEHFATATTRAVMAELNARLVAKRPEGKRLLIAAVAGNQHDLGVQAVADVFEAEGWKVISLGANVPAEDLGQAVDFFEPDVVGLSVTLLTQLPTLEQAIAAIRASRHGPKVKILVGGRGAAGCQSLVRAWGADGCVASVDEGLALANALVNESSSK